MTIISLPIPACILPSFCDQTKEKQDRPPYHSTDFKNCIAFLPENGSTFTGTWEKEVFALVFGKEGRERMGRFVFGEGNEKMTQIIY